MSLYPKEVINLFATAEIFSILMHDADFYVLSMGGNSKLIVLCTTNNLAYSGDHNEKRNGYSLKSSILLKLFSH